MSAADGIETPTDEDEAANFDPSRKYRSDLRVRRAASETGRKKKKKRGRREEKGEGMRESDNKGRMRVEWELTDKGERGR